MRLALKLQWWYLKQRLDTKKEVLGKRLEVIGTYESAYTKQRELADRGIETLSAVQRAQFESLNQVCNSPLAAQDFADHLRIAEGLEGSILRIEKRMGIIAKRLAASA